MSRRPTPWQRGRRARTSRGLISKLVQALLVLGALAMLFGTAASPSVLDDTPPLVTFTIDGIQGSNSWYRGSNSSASYVIVRWTVSDPESPITSSPGCEPAVRIYDPNSGTTATCTATSAGGTTAITTKTIKVDSDPPTGITATPSRVPDANGWYNHALGVAWSGSDATSGIASCTSLSYPGPDAAPAALSGGCTDLAGNNSSTPFSLRYDATPPQLSAVSVQSTDGANIVRWKSSSPNDIAAISRVARGSRKERALFDGAAAGFVDKKIQDGVEYRYAVRSYDQAGNASEIRTVLALPKVVPLGKIGYTPRAAGPPILSWSAKVGASYYHVQLFRNGKRILAAWPQTTQLALRARWRWAGRQYRLAPAQYAWFAWAGFGPRARAHYKLLGHSTFIVPAH
jgi:hypothetical protein